MPVSNQGAGGYEPRNLTCSVQSAKPYETVAIIPINGTLSSIPSTQDPAIQTQMSLLMDTGIFFLCLDQPHPQAFRKLDTDGDGTLTSVGFKRGMRKLGIGDYLTEKDVRRYSRCR